ncbi:TfoX/Sxy family protein [Ornithinimicrobium sp. INDO-MA30-4]|uniref:TfoX/Sxy family protein n=1 Tax=Ornithinimicrobium sp. INDO-MA30-4 TaxID=2908651 RepID=UPI001F30D3E0|nr:TfoX/Sxy family protein [Ornithinimicrobium sp. INDO-MA30-4]UJH71200.1 TfoX/Sxy family protein [Ornithinimicrobium sp. INDO-MA30-4]
MAHEEHLAVRVRDLLSGRIEAEKKMFGGLAFMVEGRMACCVSGQGGLLVKVGRDAFPELVKLDQIEPMTMADTVSDSWVHVGDQALTDERALRSWVERGLAANPPKPRP